MLKEAPLEVVMSVVMKISESVGCWIGLTGLERPWNGCMWSSYLLLSYCRGIWKARLRLGDEFDILSGD